MREGKIGQFVIDAAYQILVGGLRILEVTSGLNLQRLSGHVIIVAHTQQARSLSTHRLAQQSPVHLTPFVAMATLGTHLDLSDFGQAFLLFLDHDTLWKQTWIRREYDHLFVFLDGFLVEGEILVGNQGQIHLLYGVHVRERWIVIQLLDLRHIGIRKKRVLLRVHAARLRRKGINE